MCRKGGKAKVIREKEESLHVMYEAVSYLSREQPLGDSVILLSHALSDLTHEVVPDHHDLVDLDTFCGQ